LCRAKKPKKALLPAPTFAEYEQALSSVGCEIRYFFLEEKEDFRVKEAYLEALTDDLDILFLCNPNNPTGILMERDFLEKILIRCR
ncbi:aminotransferase class I/II-fold pyridoxal phosphate-dependent enzyme, partial [Acinetobacter baumannii]|nr:aminotransferase class I/II-fold pyridoxal phosphate-dependent enzyme [Acinetobacter baumannii]